MGCRAWYQAWRARCQAWRARCQAWRARCQAWRLWCQACRARRRADQVIAEASPGTALGLPDRNYYLHDDTESARIRTAYVAHVARSLALSGLTAAEAEAQSA